MTESLGFSMCNTSSASSDSFTSSFPIWMPFSSCFCLIALASAFNTMLNESGKSEHTCLFHDLRGKVFSFSLLSIVLAVGLTYMAVMLKYIPSIPTLLRVFVMN